MIGTDNAVLYLYICIRSQRNYRIKYSSPTIFQRNLFFKRLCPLPISKSSGSPIKRKFNLCKSGSSFDSDDHLSFNRINTISISSFVEKNGIAVESDQKNLEVTRVKIRSQFPMPGPLTNDADKKSQIKMALNLQC